MWTIMQDGVAYSSYYNFGKTLKGLLFSLLKKANFLRYQFTVYSLSQLTWSDLPRSAKC